MFKHNRFLLAFVVLVLMAMPVFVFAQDEPPPSEPDGRITAPDITGVNPDPEPEQGELSEIEATGIVQPLDVAAPPTVGISQTGNSQTPNLKNKLAAPLRYQGSDETACGIHALGMAMDFLAQGAQENLAPSSSELLNNLAQAGMFYHWGTGVEELAYLARQYGYAGSYAFHDWTLAKLRAQLQQEHPVVVSLGTNGEGQPGHFVTVTGVSDDGKWISYNDPAQGKVTAAAGQFLADWNRQGNSGMFVARKLAAGSVDPMQKWMGVFSGLSALSVLSSQLWRQMATLSSKRKKEALTQKTTASHLPSAKPTPTKATQKGTGQSPPISGLMSWQVQMLPDKGTDWRKEIRNRDHKQIRSAQDNFKGAQNQAQLLIQQAQQRSKEMEKSAEGELAHAQIEGQQIIAQAKAQGRPLIAKAEAEHRRSQTQAASWLEKAQTEGESWLSDAQLELKGAQDQARSWLSSAHSVGYSWVRAAQRAAARAEARARWLERWGRRVGRWHLYWARNQGRRLRAAARAGLRNASRHMSNHISHWQHQGHQLVSKAQGGLRHAKERVNQHVSHWRAQGVELVAKTQKGLDQARSMAQQRLQQANERANALKNQAKNNLKQAKSKGLGLISAARQQGDQLVAKAQAALNVSQRQIWEAERRERLWEAQLAKKWSSLPAEIRAGLILTDNHQRKLSQVQKDNKKLIARADLEAGTFVEQAEAASRTSQKQATRWREAAQKESEGWIRAAENKVLRAKDQAKEWLDTAYRAGVSRVRAAERNISLTEQKAKALEAWGRRCSYQHLLMARNQGRQMRAQARMNYYNARGQMQGNIKQFRTKGHQLVAKAEKELIQAKLMARSYADYWKDHGNETQAKTEKNLQQARNQAQLLIQQAKDYAQMRQNEAQNKLSQAKSQVLGLANAARQKDDTLVTDVQKSLSKAENQVWQVERQQQYNAKMSLLLSIQLRIQRLIGLLRSALTNPGRKGIGGGRNSTAAQASAARWNAMAETYNKERAAKASTARWNAQVTAHNQQQPAPVNSGASLKPAAKRQRNPSNDHDHQEDRRNIAVTSRQPVVVKSNISQQSGEPVVQQPTQPTPNAPSVFAADLSDAQVREQIAAVGGNVNMDIKQARAIIHNARIAAAVRAQEAAAEKAKAEAYANQLKHMDGSDRERLVQVAPGVWARLGDYPQPGEKQQPVLNLDDLLSRLQAEDQLAAEGKYDKLQGPSIKTMEAVSHVPSGQNSTHNQGEPSQTPAYLTNLIHRLLPEDQLSAEGKYDKLQGPSMDTMEQVAQVPSTPPDQEMVTSNEKSILQKGWDWLKTGAQSIVSGVSSIVQSLPDYLKETVVQPAIVGTANLWSKLDQNVGKPIRNLLSISAQVYDNWVSNPNRSLDFLNTDWRQRILQQSRRNVAVGVEAPVSGLGTLYKYKLEALRDGRTDDVALVNQALLRLPGDIKDAWMDKYGGGTEFAISLIPFVGDGIGLGRQGANWLKGKPVDKLDYYLSIAGLIMDLPLDGIVGDLTVATLKGLSASLSPAVRNSLAEALDYGIKHPGQLSAVLLGLKQLITDKKLIAAVTAHPQVLDEVAEFGKEGIELLVENGEKIVPIIAKYGEDAIRVLDEGYIKVGKESAKEFADEIAKATGKKVWSSSVSGAVYIQESTPEAIEAANRLVELVNRKAPQEQIDDALKELAEITVHGTSDRLVLGSFVPEMDGYILGALDSEGGFFDVGNEVWDILNDDILKDNGIEFLDLNRQVLRNQIEAGKPIEYTFKGISDKQLPNELSAIAILKQGGGGDEATEIVSNLLDPKNNEFPYRMEEVKLLIQSGYDYKFVGDTIYWTKDLLNFSP